LTPNHWLRISRTAGAAASAPKPPLSIGAATTIGRTPSPVDLAVHGDFVYVIDDKPPGAVYRFAR
jgi:hypothetical protein